MDYLENYVENNFSGFEGDFEAYTGEGDDFLDFNGKGVSFANEGATGRVFSMTIINKHTSQTKEVALLPGYLQAVQNGLIAKEGSIDSDTTGVGSPNSIDNLLGYLRHTPAHLGMVRIQSTNTLQLNQDLVVEELSPFKSLGNRVIPVANFVRPSQFRDDIVEVPLNGTIAGAEVLLKTKVLPNTSVTYTFVFGAVLSTSVGLKNKQSKAVANITAVGVGNVRKAQQIRKGLPQ